MGVWALLVDNKEVTSYRCVYDDEAREGCEEAAIDLEYAARLEHGLALVHGVEIVKYSD